jgi:cyclopropane-fatty-acyl-phospholipid synthase
MGLIKISEKFILSKLKNITNGNLKLVNYDGKVFHFGDLESILTTDIKINNPNFYFNVVTGGSSALGEAYIKNDFSTSNLTDLIELTARNINLIYSFSGSLKIQKIKNFLKKIFASNTKSKSIKYISKHYDLGNNFFSMWLDKTLTYSSALYRNSEDNLEIAQQRKFQELINLLDIKEGNKILEIGCGWGGFAEYLGKKYDVKLDCITISKKQYEYAKERIHKCGLNEKVNIQIKDYRDLKDKYNSIASIEMIEAVGHNYLQSYFKTIKKNLANSGTAAIQAITIDDNLFDRYKNKQDFIQKYIFPGGFLPSKNSLNKHVSENGLTIKSYDSYADHYSNTLALWRNEFNKKWDLIKNQGFDLTFKRMWEFYLSYCEAGFKSKNIDLIQFSLQNK